MGAKSVKIEHGLDRVSKTHKNSDWFLRYKCGDCKKFGDCERRIFPNPRSVACEYITR